MFRMFNVRVPPSCVLLLLLHRCVVTRPPSPRADITAHSTRAPVRRCAAGCHCLQSGHQWVDCGSGHRLRIFLDRFGLGCDVAAESQLWVSTDLWHPVLNGGPVRARGSDNDDNVATLLRERERERERRSSLPETTNLNHLLIVPLGPGSFTTPCIVQHSQEIVSYRASFMKIRRCLTTRYTIRRYTIRRYTGQLI
jgi:hypothetical protein